LGQGRLKEEKKKRSPQAYRMISDETFGKRERLLKSKDFGRVYKKGISFKKDSVILYCLPSGLEHNRLGFSIASKNIRLATRRNKIRRLFKEAYRRRKKDLNKGFDLVIIVKRDPGKTVSRKEIEEMFLALAKGAKILAR